MLLRFSRQQRRSGGASKRLVNGQTALYTAAAGLNTDTCRSHGNRDHHDDLYQRQDVQHCDHVTPCSANGCAALTEANRNSYG